MVVHFAFLVYVVVGGFLAWRWPRTIILHALAAAWGLVIVLFAVPCPLTGPEDYFRHRAGQDGLPGGFIDTYISGVIYPEQHLVLAQLAVAVCVAVSWIGLAVRTGRRHAAARPG